ncbi:MAG: R3H domain-containing nucleic acid-binding protein [bacterium]|nr:R3H domain-containing nucleic acid-binding protein [bacterium]
MNLPTNTELIKQEVKEFINQMGFGPFLDSVESYEGSANRFCVRLSGEANMLIGEYGVNLLAIEHLVKKVLRKKLPEEVKFTLDINDYRVKKLEDLKQDIKTAAKEVRAKGREVPLRPMFSFERRIVHLLLSEYPDITTESVGMGPERRVVIKPYP